MINRTFRNIMRGLCERSGVPFRLIQDLRMEGHLLLVRWRNRYDPTYLSKRRQLLAMREIKLHFGCGARILPGWVNLDGWPVDGTSLAVDLREPIPIATGGCQLIFSEHTLEHFEMPMIRRILKEFYRMLRPGGALRIVVPDAERYVQAYANRDLTWFRTVAGDWLSAPHSGPETIAKGLSHLFLDQYHRVALDSETIEVLLAEAGFEQVSRSVHLGSQIQELRIDSDQAWRVMTSLYVEARK